jgi:hypothetical protein
MVLNWNQGIGGAIGLWPLSDRSAARLTNAQMKEADVTGRMMRRSAKHRLVNGTSQAWCVAQNLSARVLFAFLLATDSAIGSTGAIADPCQLLALPRQKLKICSPDLVSIAGKRLMPCPTVLRFSLSTRSREEFSLLKARGIHVAQM